MSVPKNIVKCNEFLNLRTKATRKTIALVLLVLRSLELYFKSKVPTSTKKRSFYVTFLTRIFPIKKVSLDSTINWFHKSKFHYL